MSKKTYTQTLSDLTKEIKISGFESRYLGILFGLLGISIPLLLSDNLGLTTSSSFMAGMISIALVAYAPILLISLIIYYLSGDDVFSKKISIILAAAAGLFMTLFIVLASLDYKTQILSEYTKFTVPGFFVVYFLLGIIVWYKVNKLINNLYL